MLFFPQSPIVKNRIVDKHCGMWKVNGQCILKAHCTVLQTDVASLKENDRKCIQCPIVKRLLINNIYRE